jgi:hypothetical protein
MKSLLLAAGFIGALAAPAYAGTCTLSSAVKENILFSQCQGSSSAEEEDDQTWFIDKKSNNGTSVLGSLGFNLGGGFDNVLATASVKGAVGKTGNGNANIKGVGGELTSITFTPVIPSSLGPKKSPIPFLGFDGMFLRGQTTGTEVELTVNWGDGKSDSKTFTVPSTGDFGEIGFDELLNPGEFITSVTAAVLNGSWTQLKQVDFSVCAVGGCTSGVPTQTSSVPEPSTWAMMLLGFAGLGYGAFRRRAKSRLDGAPA